MSGGDPDAGGGAHRHQQIIGELPQPFVKDVDGLADGFEASIGESADMGRTATVKGS